jgi:hypothetical protein
MEQGPRVERENRETGGTDALGETGPRDLPRETEEDRERAADDGWPDPSEQAE